MGQRFKFITQVIIQPLEQLEQVAVERGELGVGMTPINDLDEVRDLLETGYSPDLPAFSAIGYSQMIQVLQGEISLDEAVMLMKRLTRQFVRRQANWFKPDDPDIHWFSVEVGVVGEIEKLVREYFGLEER